MASEFRATFVKSVIRTDKVMSFLFQAAAPVEFIPGQFAQVIFDEQNRGNKLLNKYLSFSTAPGKSLFEVTKKLSDSEFSGRLKNLRPGDPVLFKAPMGNCIFDGSEPKLGFLIGGIGITPVISILEYIVAKKLTTDVCLLYSNWTVRDIAFKPELDAWGRQNPKIKVVHTVVECKPDDQVCFSGMITSAFVQQQMPDHNDRAIFIVGPPGMVKAMQELCQGLGCPKERVKAENFVGY